MDAGPIIVGGDVLITYNQVCFGVLAIFWLSNIGLGSLSENSTTRPKFHSVT